MAEIPIDMPCADCGMLTWRKELGSADRFWQDGFVCSDHLKSRSLAAKKSADGFQQLMGWPRIYEAELKRLDDREIL